MTRIAAAVPTSVAPQYSSAPPHATSPTSRSVARRRVPPSRSAMRPHTSRAATALRLITANSALPAAVEAPWSRSAGTEKTSTVVSTAT